MEHRSRADLRGGATVISFQCNHRRVCYGAHDWMGIGSARRQGRTGPASPRVSTSAQTCCVRLPRWHAPSRRTIPFGYVAATELCLGIGSEQAYLVPSSNQSGIKNCPIHRCACAVPATRIGSKLPARHVHVINHFGYRIIIYPYYSRHPAFFANHRPSIDVGSGEQCAPLVARTIQLLVAFGMLPQGEVGPSVTVDELPPLSQNVFSILRSSCAVDPADRV